MKITVIGTGFVDPAPGTFLTEVGIEVLCLDVNPAKIKILEESNLAIFEQGPYDMASHSEVSMRLHFTAVNVTAYHLVASREARHFFPNEQALSYAGTQSEALNNAEALAIVTEWKKVRSPTRDTPKSKPKASVIVNGCDLYNPKQIRSLGLSICPVNARLVRMKRTVNP